VESLSETNKENTNLSLELENEIPLKGKKRPSYDVFSKGSYKIPSISEDSLQVWFIYRVVSFCSMFSFTSHNCCRMTFRNWQKF
jgi:hypothetical protein